MLIELHKDDVVEAVVNWYNSRVVRQAHYIREDQVDIVDGVVSVTTHETDSDLEPDSA